jgi:hypothetical protein
MSCKTNCQCKTIKSSISVVASEDLQLAVAKELKQETPNIATARKLIDENTERDDRGTGN